MSLYDDLGVKPDAHISEINAAFRRLAKIHHPDAGGSPDAFAKMQAAIEMLRDPERRAHYDATGEDKPNAGQSEAVAMLLDAFQEAIGAAPDITAFDVIAQTLAVLDGRHNQLKANRSSALAEQRKVAKALKRLGFEGDGPNVIRGLLEGKAEQVGKLLANMDLAEAAITAAREMAKGYSWQVDARPMQPGFTGFFAGSTTTATGW